MDNRNPPMSRVTLDRDHEYVVPWAGWHRTQPLVISRLMIGIGYIIASAGLIMLSFDHVLFDKYAILGAGSATVVLLVYMLFTGMGALWLGVAAAWIYAAVIEVIRGPDTYARSGLSLLFVAMALNALGAYTDWRQHRHLGEAPEPELKL